MADADSDNARALNVRPIFPQFQLGVAPGFGFIYRVRRRRGDSSQHAIIYSGADKGLDLAVCVASFDRGYHKCNIDNLRTLLHPDVFLFFEKARRRPGNQRQNRDLFLDDILWGDFWFYGDGAHLAFDWSRDIFIARLAAYYKNQLGYEL